MPINLMKKYSVEQWTESTACASFEREERARENALTRIQPRRLHKVSK